MAKTTTVNPAAALTAGKIPCALGSGRLGNSSLAWDSATGLLSNAATSGTLSLIVKGTSSPAVGIGSGGGAGFIQGYTSSAATTTGNLLLQSSGASVLVATTTDSSNGRIQRGTHTTSAGGDGYGSDVAFYRVAAGQMALDHLGGTNPRLFFRNAGVSMGDIQVSSGDLVISSQGTGDLVLRGGGVTALTVDGPTQAVTFAQEANFANGLKVAGVSRLNSTQPAWTLNTHTTRRDWTAVGGIDLAEVIDFVQSLVADLKAIGILA